MLAQGICEVVELRDASVHNYVTFSCADQEMTIFLSLAKLSATCFGRSSHYVLH